MENRISTRDHKNCIAMKTISTIQKVVETVCRIRKTPIRSLLIVGWLLGTLSLVQAQTGDYGDAPASYEQGTPARHVSAPGFLNIGFGNPDVESGPNSVAAGANNNAGAGDGTDEDAFWKSTLVGGTTSLPDINRARSTYRVYIPAALTHPSRTARVCGWIDFNRNGVFDANERACAQVILNQFYYPNNTTAGEATSGLWQLEWTLPAGTQKGVTYARFRIAFDDETGGNMQPIGGYTYGEVEDYQLNIVDLTDNITCATGFNLKPVDVLSQREIDVYTQCPPNTSAAATINYATGWQDPSDPSGGQMMVMDKQNGCFSHLPGATGWSNMGNGVPSGAEGSIGWLGIHSIAQNVSGEGATANLVTALAANKVYRGIFWATRNAGGSGGTHTGTGYIRFYGVNDPTIGTATSSLNASNSELLYQSPVVTNTLVWKLYPYTFTPTQNWQYIRVEAGSASGTFPFTDTYLYFDQFTLYECQAPDRGDAPTSYGDPSHTIPASGTTGLHIGSTAPDGDALTHFTSTAQGDNVDNTDDEGGPLTAICTISSTYSTTVNVVNATANPAARLIGWIDYNRNGTFEASEGVSVSTPATGTYTLTWTGLTGLVPGLTYGRFRLTTDATITTSTPASLASDGEVEDWGGVIVNEGGTVTPTVTSLTTCSGDQVAIDYTTTPNGQQVLWTVMPSGQTGSGNVRDFLTATGTTPSSYTYTAYIPSISGCTSNTVVTVVTVNPRPIITPSQCSQTICVGETGVISFTSSVGGTTINWLRVEDGLTGSGDISSSFPTTGTYTYKIWGTSPAPALCMSSDSITCTIVVNNACCDLVADVAVTASTNCVTPNGSFTVTYSGSGTYQYRLNGGASQVLGASPVVLSNLAAGSYTLVITNPASPTCTTTSQFVIAGPGLTVTASSNSPVCATSTLALFATPMGATGTVTYNWAGPNGFSNTGQNPTMTNVTTAASGVYSVTATDQGGCTAISSTSVTIATQPSLTISGGLSQTICSGQPVTLTVSGDGGAPVSWINSLGETGAGTTINFAGIRNVSGQSQTVTYILLANAGTCSDRKTVTITIKPAPTLQVYPQQAVICALELTNLTATAFPNTATINWSRNPTLPAPATGTGTGTVMVNEVVPAGSYTYTFTATQDGCTSTPVTSSLIVNN